MAKNHFMSNTFCYYFSTHFVIFSTVFKHECVEKVTNCVEKMAKYVTQKNFPFKLVCYLFLFTQSDCVPESCYPDAALLCTTCCMANDLLHWEQNGRLKKICFSFNL